MPFIDKRGLKGISRAQCLPSDSLAGLSFPARRVSSRPCIQGGEERGKGRKVRTSWLLPEFLPPSSAQSLGESWVTNARDTAEQRPAVSSTPRVVWDTVQFWDSGLLVAEGTGLCVAGFWAEGPVTRVIASAPLAMMHPRCISAVPKRCQDHTTIYRPFLAAQPPQQRWRVPLQPGSAAFPYAPSWLLGKAKKATLPTAQSCPEAVSSSTSLGFLGDKDPLYFAAFPSCVQQPFSHCMVWHATFLIVLF